MYLFSKACWYILGFFFYNTTYSYIYTSLKHSMQGYFFISQKNNYFQLRITKCRVIFFFIFGGFWVWIILILLVLFGFDSMQCNTRRFITLIHIMCNNTKHVWSYTKLFIWLTLCCFKCYSSIYQKKEMFIKQHLYM